MLLQGKITTHICSPIKKWPRVYSLLLTKIIFFLLLEVCFNVAVTTAIYGNEITWSLDTCQSEGTYGEYNDYSEECCLAAGVYTLTCQDSYGDGWHGGIITVQGKIYCDDFRTGRNLTKQVTVNPGKLTKISTHTHTHTPYIILFVASNLYCLVDFMNKNGICGFSHRMQCRRWLYRWEW